ncbi:hypothetical protein [Actinomadura kijaniata]|uniref:hypothetical protein n=1 Tax=Actinomadura kijaniata TaxID=46161 RepID=UPI000B2B8AFB|nr:hypothetical protein [Actinomadura kijaniata]
MSDVVRERLVVLQGALVGCGFATELTGGGLRVVGDGPGCCAAQERPAVLITCRARAEDGGRVWFFTGWNEAVAPADRVADAVAAVRGWMSGAANAAGPIGHPGGVPGRGAGIA